MDAYEKFGFEPGRLFREKTQLPFLVSLERSKEKNCEHICGSASRKLGKGQIVYMVDNPLVFAVWEMENSFSFQCSFMVK